jgi:hypothetical protein
MKQKGTLTKKIEKKLKEYFDKVDGNDKQGYIKPNNNGTRSDSDSSLSNK